MSDTGRKDFTTKAQEKMTPNSQKSTMDKMKETVTDASDRMGSGMQSDNQKSYTQQAFDSMRGQTDRAQGGSGETIAQKAKNAMGLGDH
ncbi:heat shock 9/12 family protein [Aspergillus clavatus NRRL 1]|uniref:Heat shock protein Awh11/Hsp9, putative n=1 Tax=Aspergillus clavatus (strain ATCC 1007 / CBS 513.65 / DSM 816 / NCTC 3887 / NRRL 1 / QM 1276 / 107) TaxID=344612 RepID=A1CN87_ASPCL|nr:heat shock protein Awh11/Hsp9, putative [Aspergillus clavatus NRRL 1]EAW07108.1 heat shock protein Awh11/Hsp9, putative [Aspergillus clavatus NRRL 1]